LFEGGFSVPRTVPLLGIRGDMYDGVPQSEFGGDPDQLLRPVSGTLARIPWYDTPVAQVLTAYAEAGGGLEWIDPRHPLLSVLERYKADRRSVTVATELEFYLLADGNGPRPEPLVGLVPGTNLRQEGIQYCMPDDLYDCNAFLDEVRIACDLQGVPLTAMHSEFSPGQWEINTHHQDDALRAGDHALLLRRIVKAVARRHRLGATFMAKPFADLFGSGLHIHASVYERDGRNVFADPEPVDPPRLMPALRHAIAGLGDTLDRGDGDLCAESQFLPALQGRRLRALGGELGLRSSRGGPARAALIRGQPAHRTPYRGCRRQPLPGAGRRAGGYPRRPAAPA
jgi:glutamine synthetase